MSLTAAERETVIQVDDSRGDVQLYSAQRPVIRRVLGDDRWTVIEHGEFDGSELIKATCAYKDWSPIGGMKRKSRPMTDEEKAAAAARLQKAREGRAQGF